MNSGIQEIIHPEGVIEISLNLGEFNALTPDALKEISDILHRLSESSNIRCLALTSKNEKFFSNGLDPSMMIGASEKKVRELVELIFEASSRLFFFPRPAAAVIGGHCMGAAAILSLYCDYRFMTDRGARYCFPEANIAMNVPSFTARILIDLLGLKNAANLLYTAKALKAPEAKEIGMVHEIFPASELHEKSFMEIEKLGRLPEESSSGIKEALRMHYRKLYDDLYEFDVTSTVRTILSKNTQEGFLSIVEKRRPRFS